MRAAAFATTLIWAVAASAQQPAAPATLTAEQIIEKSIEFSGGRAAMEKITSSAVKGNVTLEFAGGMTAAAEILAKAPDKFLMMMTMEGFGQVRQGFDGKVAWSEDPQNGVRELAGEQAAAMKRQAIFNSTLKWKELYPKAEVKGQEKIGDREVWAVVLTPTEGKPVTQYFDASDFSLVRQVMTQPSDQGDMEITVDLSDYRDVDGIKMPFVTKQRLPMGEMSFVFTEMKHNVEIDDARFAKPAN